MESPEQKIRGAHEYLDLYFPRSSRDLSVVERVNGGYKYAWYAQNGSPFFRVEYNDFPNDRRLQNLEEQGYSGVFTVNTSLGGRGESLQRPAEPPYILGFVHASTINAELFDPTQLEKVIRDADLEVASRINPAVGAVVLSLQRDI